MRVYSGTLRELVDRKDLIIFGGIMDSRSGAVVELYQDAGFDALLIDREHTALNTETVLEHIRLARALGFPCMVRAADDSYHELNRTLDQAPDGIYVPRITSREQVEQIVHTIMYPPRGVRGVAGSTCPVGKYYGWGSVVEQMRTVNDTLVFGIQIETREALDDLDGILSVPGVDIAVIGGDDLSARMGIPGQWDTEVFHQAVEEVFAACARHNVLPGIAGGDPQTVAHWISLGARAIWYAADIALFWSAARSGIVELEKALAASGQEGMRR
jgi:2-keto-3-deoxy-L-rhamnonate aldolase RhmA